MDGLYDRCQIKTRVGVDDGYGSITPTYVLFATVPCRRTKNTGNQDESKIGKGGSESVRFSTAPVIGLLERNSNGVVVAYIIEHGSFVYDVLSWEYRRNERGVIDHIEWFTERK